MHASSLTTVIAQDAGLVPGSVSFYDIFDPLNSVRWSVSNGWQNGPHQDCTWSATNVRKVQEALQLVLDDRRTPERAFSCAEVQSRRLYGYGTYEVRMRAPFAAGLVTSFFTYTGPTDGPARPYEQISFEFVPKDLNTALLNFSAGGRGNNHSDGSVPTGYLKVNDYAFQWLPNRVRWLINGKLVREVVASANTPIPEYAAHIIFSIRNGTGHSQEEWLGRFEYPGSPLVAAIEHVAYTQLGAPCQFPTSVACAHNGHK
jgi:endo-1,3-1,4-beta-glycanase ExoK